MGDSGDMPRLLGEGRTHKRGKTSNEPQKTRGVLIDIFGGGREASLG